MKTLAALALLASACSPSAFVQVSLTDDPVAGGVQQLILTVDEVRIHDDADNSSAGGDAGAQADGATGKGWVVLCTDVQTFDLLQYTNGRALPLCGGRSLTVAAGHVSQIRLGIKSAQLVLGNGQTQNLDIPSGPQSGLKVDVQRDVGGNQTLSIALDFVASQSLVDHGNGTWSLKPVVHLL